MSQSLNIGSGLAQEKLYALPKKLPLAQNPAMQEQALKQVADKEAQLNWVKVDNNGKPQAELKLSFSPTSEMSNTTIVTPEAVKAPAELLDIRQSLQNKFMEVLEQTYANSFHHNRLVAKVAEWSMANVIGKLALMGLSPKELEKVKKKIRKRLIEQNRHSLFQVVYDETMLEVVT
jgi:hypothetical protein